MPRKAFPIGLFFSLSLILAHPAVAQDAAAEEAQQQMAEAAEASRLAYAEMTFEEFRDSVPFFTDPDRWIVDGDVPITSEKKLREFFELSVLFPPEKIGLGNPEELIISSNGGLDHKWNNMLKGQLHYCVSTSFGSDYNKVVVGMQDAAAAWEAVADIDFIHLSDEDERCSRENEALVFDVNPYNYSGQFLATAFFPNETRRNRSLLIDKSALTLPPNDALTLTGVLRHELGHTLGFRHEHIRPDSGACFSSENWRPITNYDPLSVMHYPQCNGKGDWALRLSAIDKSGSACIYGAAAGFEIDTEICKPLDAVQSGGVVSLGPISLMEGESKKQGQFNVTPGTLFEVTMEGTGDGDLYLKFDAPARVNHYDCRPYLEGSDEKCAVSVPTDAEVASIMVHGYLDAEVSLTITGITE